MTTSMRHLDQQTGAAAAFLRALAEKIEAMGCKSFDCNRNYGISTVHGSWQPRQHLDGREQIVITIEFETATNIPFEPALGETVTPQPL